MNSASLNMLKVFTLILLLSPGCYGTASKEENKDKKPEEVTEDLLALVTDAKDYAQNIGLIARLVDQRTNSDIAEIASFTLFPSPFPSKCFQKSIDVQDAMNLLYFRASLDVEFLEDVLGDLAKTDEMTKRLLAILRETHDEGYKQPTAVLFQRADYMCHDNESDAVGGKRYELKQIEVNNGGPAGYICERTTMLHKRILKKAQMPTNVIPENKIFDKLAKDIHFAWQQFGDPKSIIMIVVPAKIIYWFEHRYVQYALEEETKHKVKIVMITMMDAWKKLRVEEDDSLWLDKFKVGLVFFRSSLLVPFKNLPAPEKYMATRRMIERTTAIKVPTIGMTLTGTKKVQQVLAKPGMVERFFPDRKDADKVAAIRETFAEMWGLEGDDKQTQAVIQDALEHPEKFILKPNREGGGNNFWGEEIVEKLHNFTADERASHILMRKLNPLKNTNYFVRSMKTVEKGDVVGELSIYATLVGDMRTGRVLRTRPLGYMVRSKWAHLPECGMNEGTGAYDTPFLF